LVADAIEAAGEALHFGATDRVLSPVALGLDVADVEAESILFDDTVDAAVARSTDRFTHSARPPP
jgi:hypothetical protein